MLSGGNRTDEPRATFCRPALGVLVFPRLCWRTRSAGEGAGRNRVPSSVASPPPSQLAPLAVSGGLLETNREQVPGDSFIGAHVPVPLGTGPQRGTLTFHPQECFPVLLCGPGRAQRSVASVCPTGRGRGWRTALLRGERAREGRLHVPGHHPACSAVQVTPAKSPQISLYHPL